MVREFLNTMAFGAMIGFALAAICSIPVWLGFVLYHYLATGTWHLIF